MPKAIEIIAPRRVSSPVVFASPHSGRCYPPDLLARSQVSERILRSSEDAYVDLLLSEAPRNGAYLVRSEVPRAYVDFNRGSDELDPALIEGAPPAGLNPRIASGLGVLARVVANGRAIYRGKLTQGEAHDRIATYWQPYHANLSALLERQRKRFGEVLLCDMHSMPHDALKNHAARGGQRPEVIVGDRWGSSSSAAIVCQVEEILRSTGLTVGRNTPFAGAYIAQRYGQPSQGMHAIQIEISRSLYLDEARVEPSAQFEAFKELMGQVVAKLAALQVGGATSQIAAQ